LLKLSEEKGKKRHSHRAASSSQHELKYTGGAKTHAGTAGGEKPENSHLRQSVNEFLIR